jgi:hypothetical protein
MGMMASPAYLISDGDSNVDAASCGSVIGNDTEAADSWIGLIVFLAVPSIGGDRNSMRRGVAIFRLRVSW